MKMRMVAAGGLIGLALILVGPATPASAHARLVGSDPPDGVLLSTPPDAVVLIFSEPVRLIPDRIAVVGPDGQPIHEGEPSAAGTEVTIPVAEVFGIGTYLVSYRVISEDSHPVAGAVTYSLGAPSEVPQLQPDTTNRVVAGAVLVDKYLGYGGLALVVGPAILLALLWPRRLSRQPVARLIWIGMGVLGLSTIAGIWLQAPFETGRSLFDVTGADLAEVLSSPFGTAHLVRLGALVSAVILLRPLMAGEAVRTDLLLLAGLGVITVGTWPISGHPIASPIPLASIVVDAVHLGAAAFWLGGLVVLAGFLLRQADRRELGVILPEWSRWAGLAVSLLLLAGLVMAVIEIATPRALIDTTYGRLLLIKIGLVGVVIATAAYSRRLVRTKLAPSRPEALRLAVIGESVVLACVLVVVSVLVHTTPGRTQVGASEPVATSADVHTLESDLYTLTVVVEPLERPRYRLHLTATTPDTGEPLRVEEWRATAALPSAGIEPAEIPLTPLLDDHATGETTLPVAGEWELRFTLRTSEIDQASVTTTVTTE
jgi:copper transport protein